MVLTDESWSKDEITWSRQERESSLDVVILSPQDSLPSGILTLGVTVSNNSEYQDQDLVHEHVLQKVMHKKKVTVICMGRETRGLVVRCLLGSNSSVKLVPIYN